MLSLEFQTEMSQLNFKKGTLPSEVEPQWHVIISSLVSERLTQLPKETRIDRFCDLENRQHTSDVIMNIFMTHASQALDELVFTEVIFCFNILCIMPNKFLTDIILQFKKYSKITRC